MVHKVEYQARHTTKHSCYPYSDHKGLEDMIWLLIGFGPSSQILALDKVSVNPCSKGRCAGFISVFHGLEVLAGRSRFVGIIGPYTGNCMVYSICKGLAWNCRSYRPGLWARILGLALKGSMVRGWKSYSERFLLNPKPYTLKA